MMLMQPVILILLAGVYFKQTAGKYRWLHITALIFKVAMGIALGLIYLYYYTESDTWIFFDDAVTLANLAREDWMAYLQFLWSDDLRVLEQPMTNTQVRSLFFAKSISFFALIGGNNYWISACWFSFLSFMCSWRLFLVIDENFQQSGKFAAIALLFFPSVIFWSSGLVKETLALSGIYLMTITFIIILKGKKVSVLQWVLTILGLYVAWSLKYYWTTLFVAVTVTSISVFFLQKITSGKYALLSWAAIFIFFSSILSLMHPNFYPHRFLEVLVTNHNDFVRISEPDKLIHYYQLSDSWWSIIINAPWALFSGLFRPLIFETQGLFSIPASIENLFLMVLAGTCLFNKQKNPANRLFSFSILIYVILLCVFLALSTPNLGTLSRYRTGFLPFFIFIISYRNPLLQYLFDRIRLLRP